MKKINKDKSYNLMRTIIVLGVFLLYQIIFDSISGLFNVTNRIIVSFIADVCFLAFVLIVYKDKVVYTTGLTAPSDLSIQNVNTEYEKYEKIMLLEKQKNQVIEEAIVDDMLAEQLNEMGKQFHDKAQAQIDCFKKGIPINDSCLEETR